MRYLNSYLNLFSFQAGSPCRSPNSHEHPESPVTHVGSEPSPPVQLNNTNLNGATPPTNLLQQAQPHNGAKPRSTNLTYAKKSTFDFGRTYTEMDRSVGPVVNSEAETLPANRKV
jgi:hypothetical protein